MHRSPRRITHLLLVLALLAALFTAQHHAKPAFAAASATTFFLLTDDNRIAALTDALPAQPTTPIAITGLNAGDTLVDIDVRPQNGDLYGLGYNSGAGTVQLYHISPLTGVATAIGTTGTFVDAGGNPVPIVGTGFGIDFNPATDRLRVVTNNGQSFRMNPNTGAFVDGDLGGAAGSIAGLNTDGPINGGATTVDAAAYTNSVPNNTVTTLYTLDSVTNSLFVQNPPNSGTQTIPLTVQLNSSTLDFAAPAGFDIPPGVNVAVSNAPAIGSGFATLTVGGMPGLYRIELSTGVATLLGTLGGLTPRGLAVQPSLAIGNALNAAGNTLIRFQMNTLGTTTSVAITGIVAGETLVGIDSRPATGQLYSLGINATANTGTLYRIDPQTGAATIIGTASQIAAVDGAGNPIDFPDPATVGYGFDINPTADRIRVTTGSGLNFRANPITGSMVDGDLGGAAGSVAGFNPDGPINGLPGGSTGVAAAAYTNNYAGTTVTTLYTIDPTSDRLFIQNPANAGTQTNGLALTLNGAPLDATGINGFDIPPGASVTTSGTSASGNGYAILTVGGVSGLYQIDLATGAATALGMVGAGTAVGGFVAWSEIPAAQLTTTATSVNEDVGTVKLTVRSTGGAPMIAAYTVGNGSATPGNDYTVISGTLMLGGGTISQTLSLPIVDDAETEGDETLDVQVLGADGVAQSLALTIVDNDPMVVFDSAEYNGSEVSGTALLTVTLEETSPTTATVKYATVDDTAIAGSDYTAISGTLTFAPGETSKNLSVPIIGDLKIDAGETFTVTLRDPVGAVLCTIIDARVTISEDKPVHQLFLPRINK